MMRKIRYYNYNKPSLKRKYQYLVFDITDKNDIKKIPFDSGQQCAMYLGLSNAVALRNYTSVDAIVAGKVFKTKDGKIFKIRRVS